jgi:hypothetical protein
MEQMAALQERGLAPGELPVEQEDQPSYAQWEGESERRSSSMDRDDARRGGGARGQRPRARPAINRPREQRELRDTRATRERRPGRESREGRELTGDFPAPPPMAPPRPLGPMRPTVGPGGPIGPRPPFTGPAMAGPRPAPRADMLRRNAERMQQEQTDRAEIRTLLGSYSGEEADDAAMEKFFSQLAVETGVLPPLHIVREALQKAGNATATEVGNQVRLHYRRAKSRPMQARAEPAPVAPEPVAVG